MSCGPVKASGTVAVSHSLWAIDVASDDVTVVTMFEPIDYDSLDLRTRCQIRRMEGITGESRSQVIRKAIDEYYQRVMAAATEEQLQRERDAVLAGH